MLAVTSLDDSPEFAAVRSCATRLAAEGGEVVLFEITAASYLVSPYPEENRRQWIRTLGEPELRRLGRSPVARQMEVIKARGGRAQAILPTSHGFRHLAEWAEREDADLILIPVSLVNPGLFERLRGYSLKSLLEHTNAACAGGVPRRVNVAGQPRASSGFAAANGCGHGGITLPSASQPDTGRPPPGRKAACRAPSPPPERELLRWGLFTTQSADFRFQFPDALLGVQPGILSLIERRKIATSHRVVPAKLGIFPADV